MKTEIKLNPEWRTVEGIPNKLVREYKFKNWLEAMDFAAKVSEIAESQNHHPYLELTWGYVKIAFWSHDVGAITERDYKAAAAIDAL